MSKQHTPGPWRVTAYVDGEPRWIEVYSVDPCLDVAQAVGEANARLIASAPAILEALQQIAWKLERKTSAAGKGGDCEWAKIDRNDAVMGIARAAIAQATGEEA